MIKTYKNIECKQLVSLLNSYLNVATITESASNGLQISGQTHVRHIALAVSSNLRTIQAAHELGADTLLVHHGLFWGQKLNPIEGILRKRIEALLKNNLNLIAYHLPLDVHPRVGNNAQLAKELNIDANPCEVIKPLGLVYKATVTLTLQELLSRLTTCFERPVHYYLPDSIELTTELNSLAWCSGAGADYMAQASSNCFITGEVKEHHFDEARELGCVLIQAGHYATERYGVQALGQWIEEQLNVKTTFIEANSPL